MKHLMLAGFAVLLVAAAPPAYASEPDSLAREVRELRKEVAALRRLYERDAELTFDRFLRGVTAHVLAACNPNLLKG